MIYGYLRCSTNEQKQDINRQRRELNKIGVKNNDIFWEYESGNKLDRIQLNRLLDIAKDGDTIATTEVSRLTRSTKQLCEIIEIAKKRNIKLIIGTLILNCSTEIDPMTDGMLKMMGVFAEMERAITSRRVKSGMENAKAKGIKIGRPKLSIDNIPSAFFKHYIKLENKQINVTELARLCNRSRQMIYRYLNVYKNQNIVK